MGHSTTPWSVICLNVYAYGVKLSWVVTSYLASTVVSPPLQVNMAETDITRMSSDYADNELELFRKTVNTLHKGCFLFACFCSVRITNTVIEFLFICISSHQIAFLSKWHIQISFSITCSVVLISFNSDGSDFRLWERYCLFHWSPELCWSSPDKENEKEGNGACAE